MPLNPVLGEADGTAKCWQTECAKPGEDQRDLKHSSLVLGEVFFAEWRTWERLLFIQPPPSVTMSCCSAGRLMAVQKGP